MTDTIAQLHQQIYLKVIAHYYSDATKIMLINESSNNANSFLAFIPDLGPVQH